MSNTGQHSKLLSLINWFALVSGVLFLAGYYNEWPELVVIGAIVWFFLIVRLMNMERAMPKLPSLEGDRPDAFEDSIWAYPAYSVYYVVPMYTYFVKATASLVAGYFIGKYIYNSPIDADLFIGLLVMCLFFYCSYNLSVPVFHRGANASLIINEKGLNWNGDTSVSLVWDEIWAIDIKYIDICTIRGIVYVKGIWITLSENLKDDPNKGGDNISLLVWNDEQNAVFIHGPFQSASYEQIVKEIRERSGKELIGRVMPWH